MLLTIMGRVHAGTARPSDTAMLPSVASLPQSITISTLSTLKTWVGLVDEANKAGISIKAKAWQLWNVGGGLPLDALKKGAIDAWTCSYKLDEGEISPLINALEGNSSLVTLKLADSGLEWYQEDSSGMPLVAAMANDPAALSGLQKLVISNASRCELPIHLIREGGPPALAALQAMEFFKSSTSAESVFRQIDLDGSGTIDGAELRKFFKSPTLDSSCKAFAEEFDGELEKMFDYLDEDGIGEIGLDQWRRGFPMMAGGPWHDEIIVMGELLRRDRNATVTTDGQRKASERIVKLLEEVHARTVARSAWELRVKQFMVEGHVRPPRPPAPTRPAPHARARAHAPRMPSSRRRRLPPPRPSAAAAFDALPAPDPAPSGFTQARLGRPAHHPRTTGLGSSALLTRAPPPLWTPPFPPS